MATGIPLVTDRLIDAFLQCKYKSYLHTRGCIGQISEYQSHREAQSQAYQLLAASALCEKQRDHYEASRALCNPATLKSGHSLLLNVLLNGSTLQATIDALEKINTPSILGDFSYVPIQYCRDATIPRTTLLLLAFRSIVLGAVQGRLPTYGVVLYGPILTRQRVKLAKWQRAVEPIVTAIRSQITTPGTTLLVLNSHCPLCEFQQHCKEESLKTDDLSLLRGITAREIAFQKHKGIFTVNQLSYTFRHRKPSKRAKHHSNPHHFALQALSLRTNTVHIHGTPPPPSAPTTIYFDIEGLPDQDFYYLIGAVVITPSETKHYAFWASHKAEQHDIFRDFVQLVMSKSPCNVFHYGRYDTDALKIAQESFDEETKQQASTVLGMTTDLHNIVHSHVYFPTYSNSLKDIASYLGFRWTSICASGTQSIIWRDSWEISKQPSLKEELILYNREDCLALRAICDFIHSATAAHGPPGSQEPGGVAVVNTGELQKQRSKWVRYGRPTFSLSDLERASNCAHFDYQRERVYARADKKLARANRRRKRRSSASKPNRCITLACKVCTLCGSSEIRGQRRACRRVIDLRFTKTGVKRWVTKYSARAYHCTACGKPFLPEGWPTYRGRYGDALAIWCVYQNIACRQTMWQVNDSLTDMFGIRLASRMAYTFKTRVIGQYSALYDELWKYVLKSAVLCIDECDVTIRNTKGYVWVFAAKNAVWYMYKDTRSGDFLSQMMDGFAGVLISDFYSAYDSINCAQQKCLLHLLRDFNEDLQRNPFDEEFKSMAQHFGGVLRSAVETIDRRGLKKWFLHKHKREADKLLSDVSSHSYTSEVARAYQKRFKKYGSRLFTFLEYDGVSWNNNGAEYSVKYFMKYRRMSDGLFSERSLKEALVMLSIFQTCKLNGVNPLRFMLSKNADIKSILG